MNLIQRTGIMLVISVLCVSVGLGQVETITLMHVNDSHSNLAPIGPRGSDLKGSLGGLARVATVVNEERLTNPNLLLLHAGDLFVGDMFFNKYFGVPELKTLQLLGFDAMAVGNHEFDLTPAVLYQSLETAFPHAGFPLLSANVVLDDPAVQPLKKHIRPYIIKQVGSIKVGIFGMTTPSTNLLSLPSPAVIDMDVPGIAANTVTQLRENGCQLVILLSHLGVDVDKAVAQNVPGINVIVGGHDHFLFDKPIEVINPFGQKTWIVQANAFYLNLGKMTLRMKEGKVLSMQYKMMSIDSRIPEAPLVAASVQLLIKGIERTYGPVYTKQVAYAKDFFAEVATDLTTAGNKDTPIGNLVTDAYKATTGTDVAISVGGSTAEPLYKGPLVASDFFRVVGYGFNTDNGLGYRLATFKMTGSGLVAGLEYGVSDFDQNYDEFLVQSAGIKYSYDPTLQSFGRVTSV
ncbi:MAG TPA: 5'-nucleotidase C-terminal domain-containing protein, partial [Bacteroidota bacterium]|nr:5'-nucleotidase C-terminal domain-containing protein [Bacteroidota bacterium]